jgi:hypothetical protein
LKKFSYETFLPLAELAVWSVLILLPALQTVLMFGRLDGSVAIGDVSLRSKAFEFSLIAACDRQFVTILNLNLHGAIIGAPISVPSAVYFQSHPGFSSQRIWHALTLPFFSIPAWWLVGRGLDAFLSRTRARLPFRVTGLILAAACIALAIGIVTSNPDDKRDLMPVLPGVIFWSFAFGVLPLTWFMPQPRIDNTEPA